MQWQIDQRPEMKGWRGQNWSSLASSISAVPLPEKGCKGGLVPAHFLLQTDTCGYYTTWILQPWEPSSQKWAKAAEGRRKQGRSLLLTPSVEVSNSCNGLTAFLLHHCMKAFHHSIKAFLYILLVIGMPAESPSCQDCIPVIGSTLLFNLPAAECIQTGSGCQTEPYWGTSGDTRNFQGSSTNITCWVENQGKRGQKQSTSIMFTCWHRCI